MKLPSQPGQALGMVEISSIARGYVVLDALVKRAESRVLMGAAVTPGKFLIAFDGPVAEVEESVAAATETADAMAIDRLFLPGPHEQVIPGLFNVYPDAEVDALGIAEFGTVCAAIRGLDQALKEGEVDLVTIRLASSIDGKGYFAITGELFFVEASIDRAVETGGKAHLINREIIARPHPDFVRYLMDARKDNMVLKVI